MRTLDYLDAGKAPLQKCQSPRFAQVKMVALPDRECQHENKLEWTVLRLIVLLRTPFTPLRPDIRDSAKLSGCRLSESKPLDK